MSTQALSTAGLMFSEQTDAILPALLEAKRQLGGQGVRKNATNNHLGNAYSDINAIVEVMEPVLLECGLVSMTAAYPDPETRVVDVSTTVAHAESGQWVRRSSLFEVSNLAAQAVAGCETYGRRYNHTGLFNLRAEDDDGNTATQAAPKGGMRAPSAKAIKFAETLAAERGVEVPDEAYQDGKVCSKFIDDLKQMKVPGASDAQNEATQPGAGSAAAKGQTYAKAKEVILASAPDDLASLREQVESHKALSVEDKTSLCDLINRKMKAAA